jgi:methylated-DNA-[protein]-cysteine S-methyltransferase
MSKPSPVDAAVFYSYVDSALGQVLVTSQDNKLTGLYFKGRHHARTFPTWTNQDDLEIFAQTEQQLDEFANGERKTFDLPISLNGTPFRMQVWAEIAKIPFGETITYAEIAELLDKPDAVRAVGTATGSNPLSIIIPCHRVVGKCGTLTGYAGGIPRKTALLDFESGKTPSLYSDPFGDTDD